MTAWLDCQLVAVFDAQSPQTYPRRILLAVTGLSPQVVTETLYALAVKQYPSWIPGEIHLITTREGAERARLALLSSSPGWFQRLCRDYGLPPIAFDEAHIDVLRGADNQPLEDIRTPEDNCLTADFITGKVRQFTADSTTALHVSIAGGRKTMGYYLGYALSLFGRPQDRLSHVLVSEPFESSWNFFYPTPYNQIIETHDKALADTRDADVALAEIPFISLRDGLPKRLQQGQASFSGIVAAARKVLEPPELVIDLAGKRIIAAGEAVAMKDADLAFYSMMARRRKQKQPPLNCLSQGLAEKYLEEYQRLVGEFSGDFERAEKALNTDDLKVWFEQRKSKTNRAIRDALGETLARQYLIHPSGNRPHTRFGLSLPPEAIGFDDGKLAGAAHQQEILENHGS